MWLNPQENRIATKRHKITKKVRKEFVRLRPYFLKRLSKALRASDGLMVGALLDGPPESLVSRSMDVRAMKNSQRFRRSFLVMRTGISCVHSNRAAVSKWRQFLQERRSALHFGHWLS